MTGFITTNLYDKGIQRTQISSAVTQKRDKLSKIFRIFKQVQLDQRYNQKVLKKRIKKSDTNHGRKFG